jgi:hypothetical protein
MDYKHPLNNQKYFRKIIECSSGGDKFASADVLCIDKTTNNKAGFSPRGTRVKKPATSFIELVKKNFNFFI